MATNPQLDNAVAQHHGHQKSKPTPSPTPDVPVKDSAKKAAQLIKGAKEIYYPGAPHGITATHQDQINAELLAFIKGEAAHVAHS